MFAAFDAHAVEWRRAGVAAVQVAKSPAEPGTVAAMHAAVRPAAWHARVGAPAEPAYDPFEIPAGGEAAAPSAPQEAAAASGEPNAREMNATGRPGPAVGPSIEGNTTSPSTDAATTAAPQFDPFDEPVADNAAPEEAQAPTQSAAASMGRPSGAPGSVGPKVDVETDGGFDVQEAFDEPRRGAVGPQVEPQVEHELEEAGEAVQDEIIRRGGERQTPQGDGSIPPNPFRPEDAADAPKRDRDRGTEEPGTADEGFDEDDLDQQFQQTPGGFDIRPLNQQPPMTPEQEAAHRAQLERERVQSEETCEQFLAAVKADNIKTVSLDIRMHGEAGEDYPFECGLGEEMFRPRSWPQITYLWKASGLCHKPLYFEQVQMERYGHSWGPILDPVVAGVHFFGTFPVLPYKMGLETPNECIYSLGYYRPGSCAPYMIGRVPFTWRAAAFEAAVWTGGAFAIP